MQMAQLSQHALKRCRAVGPVGVGSGGPVEMGVGEMQDSHLQTSASASPSAMAFSPSDLPSRLCLSAITLKSNSDGTGCCRKC